jgi:hypothetical protein
MGLKYLSPLTYSRAHTQELDRLIDTVRETQEPFHGERYWERTEEERRREKPVAAAMEAAMLFLGGSKSAFRCDCGGNVFTKLGPTRYQCNSCSAIYEGASE